MVGILIGAALGVVGTLIWQEARTWWRLVRGSDLDADSWR